MLKILLILSLIVGNIFAEEEVKESKDVFQLDEIVVTGSRTEKLIREEPANISIISKEKIESGHFKDVGEAISNLPSVNVDKYGTLGSSQSVLLRGISSKGTLVLLNGVPLNGSYSGDVDLSSLPLDNIERIEVLRGPASSLYGANAVGGAINIITKNKVERPKINLSGSYGTFNTSDLKFSFENKFNDLSLNLGGSYKHTDGERVNSKYDAYNLNGVFAHNFSNLNNIKINFGGFKSELGTPGTESAPSTDTKQRTERIYSLIEDELNINEDMNLKFKLFGARNILNYYTSYGDTLGDEKNLDFETYYNYNLGGINTLVLGAKYRYDVLEQSDIGNKNATTKSIYLQDTLDLLGSWIFTGSVRYDNHSAYGNSINPSLSLIYNIIDNVQIKAGIGTSFKAPTFADLYWPYQDLGMYGIYEGNPNIAPEKSTSYDIGISYELENFLFIKETYFRNDMKDMIEWAQVDPNDLNSKWTPSNVGKAFTYGLESELKIAPFSNLTGYITHIWLFSKDEGLDKELPYRPKNKVNLGIEYDIFGQKLNVDCEYYDKRFTNKYNTRALPNFIKTNVQLTSKILDNLTLTLKVENVENVPYQLRYGYPMPGRTFNVGANFSF